MPTGYTSIIDDEPDVTFEQYAWCCARAFGALVMMRDDPTDAPVPKKIEPSVYHRDALTRAEARLGELKTMTLEQAKALGEAEHQSRRQKIEEDNIKEAQITKRYEEMARKVKSWKPPSPDHKGMKEFMLEQLNTGRPDYARELTKLPEPQDPEEWLKEQRASAVETVKYHRKHWEEDQKRAANSSEWLSDLRTSLGI